MKKYYPLNVDTPFEMKTSRNETEVTDVTHSMVSHKNCGNTQHNIFIVNHYM